MIEASKDYGGKALKANINLAFPLSEKGALKGFEQLCGKRIALVAVENRLKGKGGRLLKTHLDKAVVLQSKARQDVNVIDLLASPTPISPAGAVVPEAGASGLAQPAYSQPGFLSPEYFSCWEH